jgi:hypothetical protein
MKKFEVFSMIGFFSAVMAVFLFINHDVIPGSIATVVAVGSVWYALFNKLGIK